MPLFVVRPGETETYWAERIEGILQPPVKQLADGETELYTFNEPLEARRVSTNERFAAVRPVTGDEDSRRTTWRRDGDEYVLVDSEGAQCGQVEDTGSATEHDVPGVYTYDPDANEYIVTTGATRETFDSKAAFEAEWVTVKKPFIPEDELLDPNYGPEDYHLLILPEDSDPLVYTLDGSTAPLTALLETSANEEGVTAVSPQPSPPDSEPGSSKPLVNPTPVIQEQTRRVSLTPTVMNRLRTFRTLLRFSRRSTWLQMRTQSFRRRTSMKPTSSGSVIGIVSQ